MGGILGYVGKPCIPPGWAGLWAVRRWGDDVQVVGLCPRPRSSALWCKDGFVNQEGGAFPLPGPPKVAFVTRLRPGPARRRPKPLVSYQTYRQLSGWDFHPLVIRAVGAHINIPVSKPRMTGNTERRWMQLSDLQG